MRIQCDINKRITITPENNLDIYNLGKWSHKIPMVCHYAACENYRNELISVSIKIKHLLVLLEKCKINNVEF